jgi:hypothetical protein
MPETITYEIVGNYICKTESHVITFSPIISPQGGFFFYKDPGQGMTVGGMQITALPVSREGATIVVKPSFQEFKNIIMKKIASVHNGGTRSRKTRRNV